MLSAADGCELSTTTRENPLEEIQEAATSSLFPPPVFQDMWLRVQLLCAEGNAQCQWDSAIDKASPPVSATKWWGNDETDLLMSSHKTLSLPDLMSYLCGLALRIWTSFWRREGSTGMDMWNAPVVQLRQPLTYRLMESVGLGGPRWLGSSWQRGIAESGSSHDRHTRRADMRSAIPAAASFLEGDVDVAPELHLNQKFDDRMIIHWVHPVPGLELVKMS